MTMRRRCLAGLAVLCITGATTPVAFGQDVTLRYRWTTGEEFRSRLTQQSITTISGMGLPGGVSDSSVDFAMTQVLRTIVDDVAADGTGTLRQVIESVRVEINTPAGKSVFDSTSADSASGTDLVSKSMAASYAAMVGQSITLVTAPTGSVQKIEGLARLLDRMLSAQPTAPVPPTALVSLRNTFSDDATRDLSGWGIAAFPDRPLTRGDTWEDRFTSDVPILGAMTVSRTWIFQGVETRDGLSVARLTAKQTTKTDPPKADSQAIQPSTLAMMERGEGSGESEILFDAAKGRLLRGTTQATQPMTMVMPAAGGGGARMLIKSTVTVEWLAPITR